MSKKRNCPNCGAPYNTELSKCPYCGTSYFDMSALDIDNQEPFYLKIRYGNYTFTSLVIPERCNIEHSQDSVDICGYNGVKLSSFVTSQSLFTDIRFRAIVDQEHNRLASVSFESEGYE